MWKVVIVYRWKSRYCLSILKYLSIHAKYTDIDNAGYNINIGMEALMDEIKMFSIQIKYKI